MGWTVYYEAHSSDRVLTQADADEICVWLEPWTEKLHDGCEGMWMKPRNNGLWGFTKVQYSSDSRADFLTVIRAIQALAAARPDLRFTISDDFYITADVEPMSVGDPETFMARLDRKFALDPISALDRMFGRS